MKKIATLILCIALWVSYAKSQDGFTATSTYRLTGFDVYINEGATPSQEEIDAYRATLSEEYMGTLLEFGPDGQIRFATHGGTETRNETGTESVWEFLSATCSSCSKTLHMLILSESETEIVYAMQDEDGNLQFRPKLTYTKQ